MIPAGSAAPEIGLMLPPQEDLVLATINEPADASTSPFSTGRGKSV